MKRSTQIIHWTKSIPTGTASLFFIQIFSTLAYSVLYVTLVLFSIEALHVTTAQANTIMATFVAFNFALHLFGGAIGGRLLSFRSLFLIGMILQTIGCLFIAQLNAHSFILGMAIFLVGSGMDLPSINCMIAQLYTPEDNRKEYAFLWNYSGMNIGFFIGITIAGLFQKKQDFSHLFFLVSFSNIIALILMLIHWKKFRGLKAALADKKSVLWIRRCIAFVIIFSVIFAMKYILTYAIFSTQIILILGIIVSIAIIILTALQKEERVRNKLIAYCIFAIASLIFYTIYELIPMALTLFLERNVDRHLFGITIPTAWFLNINTFIIIFGCPALASITHSLRKKGRHINLSIFFSTGLIFIGLAIFIIPTGIYFANPQGFIDPSWLIATYVLLALAEICLSPIGYAVVAKLAPENYRGFLMGAWLMISGVSAILSKIFSNIAASSHFISPLISNPGYNHTFFYLGITGIIFGLIIGLLNSYLNKLTQG